MRSGGETRIVHLDPYQAKDFDKKNGVKEDELINGLRDQLGNKVTNITDNDFVLYNNQYRKWSELKNELIAQGKNVAKGGSLAGANPPPQEASQFQAKIVDQQASDIVTIIHLLEQEVSKGKNGKPEIKFGNQTFKTDELPKLKQILQALAAQMQRAGQKVDRKILEKAGLPAESGNGNGNGAGMFSAKTGSVPVGQQPGPAGGAPGAKAMSFGGGSGFGGGDPSFGGMQPPTSSQYGAALYLDGAISDGLGQLNASRRDGQKLMMLFFYFARMAESGDPFAMYNFIKFITYIIAKDKARQNIQIGSKLIQLQDLSRKATETLMNADTADPNKTNDFLKALHQAKSQESTISTSQKLLADMLQEYSHVTEGLINSTKSLQEFWGRALRTVSRPA